MRSWLSRFLVLALLALPSTGLAQDDADASRAGHRAGLEAAQEGRWEDALAAFEEAFRQRPRPALLINVASAQAELGRLLEARATLRDRFLTLAREAEVSDAIRSAAEQALGRIESRIARIVVRAEGEPPPDTILIDGAPHSIVASGVEVNPGTYAVVVRRGEQVVHEGRIELDVGEREELEVTMPPLPPPELEPGPSDESSQTPIATPPPTDDEDDGSDLASEPGLWIGVVLGVLALGAGAFVISWFALDLGVRDRVVGNLGDGVVGVF